MTHHSRTAWRWRSPSGIALLVFLGIAAFFLVAEHWVHIIPVLPWLLLLACPFMHLFMHGGHGGHGGHGSSHNKDSEGGQR
ncbi:DUF2933 domain-containing protein [Myxosarcina sp. GI1]|uniref:DUF2933 domain-containing protein n=1 Tax=Myxosarcina sp. GI1 TaxID=1541065 RepID=UPI000569D5BC|nr:DUF2933 domain-containing protein [Myxosarcina sp. GI1]